MWHAKTSEETLKLLQTTSKGLGVLEVKKRLRHFGRNVLPRPKTDSLLKLFLRQFQSPLVYILFIATAIVTLMEEYVDGGIILLVLLVNAVVGAFQEGKAAATLEALQKFISTSATVLRDGKEILIPDTGLVPGDILVLREGEKVPADARVLETSGLRVNESSITGESEPVDKQVDPILNKAATLAEKNNMLFKGTLITGGSGQAVVVNTGTQTEIGEISSKVAATTHEIPLQKHLRELSNLLIIIILGISTLIFFVGIAYGTPAREMFSTVVALAVSAIPEGLPIAVTLILASGVWRMSKRNALVKKLQAVEALGHVDVVAVDKTGTITKNELTAVALLIEKNHFEITGTGYEPEGQAVLGKQAVVPAEFPGLVTAAKIFALTSNAKVYKDSKDNTWQIAGDPIEAALLILGKKLGVDKEDLLQRYEQVEELTFDYKRKFHATVHKVGKKYLLSAVGAPEAILELCAGTKKQAVMAKVKKEAAKGLRVLGFAYQENAKPLSPEDHPKLKFGGLVCLQDQMQEGVAEAVKEVQEAGIKVVMLTGDNPVTAKSIAEQAGIATVASPIIHGHDLTSKKHGLTHHELTETSVFARVTPDDKLAIVAGYGKLKKTIAMTGDGVNDAPALVAADLGLAMGKKGTEVAKEAADIVLLDDNFSSIVAAVEEGRNMYMTIKKVLMYLLSTSLGELLSISIAVLLALPLPLLAPQIIWLNLVTNGFLTIAFGFEPKSPEIMKHKFNKPSRFLLDKASAIRMLVMGLTMAGVTLWIFIGMEGDLTLRRTMALTVLAVVQWFNAWNSRTEKSIFKTNPVSNPWLLVALVIVVLLQLCAIYLPFLQQILGTIPLTWKQWMLVISTSTFIFVADELWKVFHGFYIHLKNIPKNTKEI